MNPGKRIAVGLAAAAVGAAVWIAQTKVHDTVYEANGSRPSLPSADKAGADPVASNSFPREERMTPESRENEISRLENLAWQDDRESLQSILKALDSPERDIRWAAIAAARSFGSGDAIPALRAHAARSTEAEEARELAETADFLELPALTEASNGQTH